MIVCAQLGDRPVDNVVDTAVDAVDGVMDVPVDDSVDKPVERPGSLGDALRMPGGHRYAVPKPMRLPQPLHSLPVDTRGRRDVRRQEMSTLSTAPTATANPFLPTTLLFPVVGSPDPDPTNPMTTSDSSTAPRAVP